MAGVRVIQGRGMFMKVGASTAGGIIGYKGEMRHFARSVLGLEKPGADLYDGAKAVQIAEAIWDSSCTGNVVKI